MDISLTEDQTMIADAVGDLLTDVWPRDAMRAYAAAAPAGDDSALWATLTASEYPTILVPEDQGGGGATLLDVTPVVERFGYHLAPGRFTTSAVVSSYAVTRCAPKDLTRRLLDGTTRLATAVGERLTVTAATGGRGALTLTGAVRHVPDVRSATHLLVLTGDAVAVLDLIDPPTGLTVQDSHLVDTTRSFSTVVLDGVTVPPDALLTAVDGAAELLARTTDVKMLATVADSLGGAQRALEMAVAYAKQRHQFGRPIGSFQALQHLLADAYVAVENLRSATWYAAHAVHRATEDREFALLAASVLASKTYLQVADLNIQVHGGMGFTVEVDAYLYAARAKVNELADGSLASRTARIAHWLRTADLPPLVEYLGGQRRQLASSMFATA